MNHKFLRLFSVCIAAASVLCCCSSAPATTVTLEDIDDAYSNNATSMLKDDIDDAIAAVKTASKITSSNFTIDDEYIFGVYAGCTLAHINAGIDQKGEVEIWHGAKKLESNEKVSTGDWVNLMDGSTVKQTLEIVVTGDVSGNSLLNAADLLFTQMGILGIREISGARLKAADISGNEILDTTDLVMLQQYVLGIGTPTVSDGFYGTDGLFYAVPHNLGNPGLSRYASNDETNNMARTVWDMQAYGGKVYFGSGDYDKNQSPAFIGCYDPKTDEAYIFQNNIDDEQVDRFNLIDGKLIVPGIDPSNNSVMHYMYLNEAENSFVNYYMNTDGRLHNFDMAGFDGKVFMGGGTNGNVSASAVAMSTDGGKSFSNVGMYYEGKLINGYTVGGFSRVYDFFELDGELYALFIHRNNTDGGSYNGIYKYDTAANTFNYYSPIDVFESGRTHAYYGANNDTGYISYGYCQADITVSDKLAVCNGDLLITEDLKNYTQIKPFEGIVFTDIVYANDTLYALGMYPNDEGGITNHVYKSTDLKNFTEVMRFDSTTHMRSMEYVDGTFVFGAGARRNSNASYDSGTIYRVKVDF